LLQLASFVSSAQANNEQEIRKLEDMEGQALMEWL